MIASMTGFGRGESEVEGYTATVELRSVNSRYCEIGTRLPRALGDRDADIQRIVKETFSRGRISLSVQVTEPVSSSTKLKLDHQVAAAYHQLIEELRSVTGIQEETKLEHFLRFPDLFTEAEADPSGEDQLWEATKNALRLACQAMQKMRRQEGDALKNELNQRLDGIEGKLDRIERLAPERVPAVQERLRERLAEILDDGRIDPDRLEFEMAMLADKLDVREECVRMHSHLVLFREALTLDEPVGRKLNFLSQEMNREINTIGSKSNDAEMSHLVVGLKEELEKIREQVENVE